MELIFETILHFTVIVGGSFFFYAIKSLEIKMDRFEEDLSIVDEDRAEDIEHIKLNCNSKIEIMMLNSKMDRLSKDLRSELEEIVFKIIANSSTVNEIQSHLHESLSLKIDNIQIDLNRTLLEFRDSLTAKPITPKNNWDSVKKVFKGSRVIDEST